jgi:pimeloyl-ACP methyl ester carboxylesterase
MDDRPAFVEERLAFDGVLGDALVRVPTGGVRAGLVTLHPASNGHCDQPLFTHLAETLAPLGVAVFSYDRRPPTAGAVDTALAVQARDAAHAMDALRTRYDVACGLYGFSQGAWAAVEAAARSEQAWLVLLGWSGVSPAEQMRFHTDELLRSRRFGDEDRATALLVRLQLEQFIRSGDGRDALAATLGEAVGQAWFEHAYLPAKPPSLPTWADMDVDPTAPIDDIGCPVLAMWGADEECSPPQPGIDALRRARSTDVTTVLLPGCGHEPKPGSGNPDDGTKRDDGFSPDYTAALHNWFAERLGGPTTSGEPP